MMAQPPAKVLVGLTAGGPQRRGHEAARLILVSSPQLCTRPGGSAAHDDQISAV
jgi:hypothetical protein